MFYLIFVLNFNVSQFIKDDVGLFATLEKQLCHVRSLGSKLQNVLIIHGHVWLDMVEEESLKQVRPVNFDVNFFEK